MRSRWIVSPTPEGWQDFALYEWELEAAESTDLHHHDEVNIIIARELHVRAAGTTVIARQGDAVRVAAGKRGTYWAPRYARLIAIYGPNDGHPDEKVGYRALGGAIGAESPPLRGQPATARAMRACRGD